jgi:dephospho-CoA kinase
MKVFGLTGGIGSGKSTVAQAFRALGGTVIDADELARVVVQPGKPAWQDIERRWPQVIQSDGTLDRKKLGDIVFADPEQRAVLNAITHPRIGEETARLTQEAEARGEPLVFYEAALLVENGLADAFDGLIVVTAPEGVQVARVCARDHVSEAAARARIGAQLPLQEKVKRATWVIENSGPVNETVQRATELFKKLRSEAGG